MFDKNMDKIYAIKINMYICQLKKNVHIYSPNKKTLLMPAQNLDSYS